MVTTVACVRPFTLGEITAPGDPQFADSSPALPYTLTYVGGDFDVRYTVALASDVALTVGGAKVVLNASAGTATIQDSSSTVKATGSLAGADHDVKVTMVGTLMTVKLDGAEVCSFDWTGTTGFPIDSGSFVWSTTGTSTMTDLKVYQGYIGIFDPFLIPGALVATPQGYEYSALGSAPMPVVDANGVRNGSETGWAAVIDAGNPPDKHIDYTYDFMPATYVDGGTNTETVDVIFRYQDEDNFCYARLSYVTGDVYFNKRVAGVDSQMAGSTNSGIYTGGKIRARVVSGVNSDPEDTITLYQYSSSGGGLVDSVDYSGVLESATGVGFRQHDTSGYGIVLAQTGQIPAAEVLAHASGGAVDADSATISGFTAPAGTQAVCVLVCSAYNLNGGAAVGPDYTATTSTGEVLPTTVTFGGIDVPALGGRSNYGSGNISFSIFLAKQGPKTGDVVVGFDTAPDSGISVVVLALSGANLHSSSNSYLDNSSTPSTNTVSWSSGNAIPAIALELVAGAYHGLSGTITQAGSDAVAVEFLEKVSNGVTDAVWTAKGAGFNGSAPQAAMFVAILPTTGTASVTFNWPDGDSQSIMTGLDLTVA